MTAQQGALPLPAPLPPDVDPAEDRVARAGLSLRAHPTREVALRIRTEGAPAVWRRIAKGSDEAERLLDASAAVGVRFVVPGDPDWPTSLDVLSVYTEGAPARDEIAAGRHLGVPFGIWVRGDRLPPTGSVALVGARAATPYGLHVATEMGAGLADRGVCVVSGAAFGIDAAAHRGALAVDGHTVAVLACGLDLAYPQAHDALIAHIAQSGSVLSEQPLGTAVRRQTFLQRNRLIAALSAGTVLVEAGLRSGARNTTAHAGRLGRPRFAVPGPVTSALSSGCHALLRDERESAGLVIDAADVVNALARSSEIAPHVNGPSDPRDGLGAAALALLEVLPPRRPMLLEEAARLVGLDTRRTFGLLSALEAQQLVEPCDDGYRLTVLGRAPTTR